MAERLIRSTAADLVIRGDGRTVYGLVVPFGATAEVSDGGPRYRERFVPGAFTRTISERGSRVKLLANHGRGATLPIGRAESLVEDRAGLVGSFRVSKTIAGDEALELVADGALDAFSVGFQPHRQRTARDGVVERTEVRLDEVSIVAFPAYDGALISGIRAATPSISGERAMARLRILEKRFQ